MSTIIHVPAPDALPATPADLPSSTTDDGSDAIYLEFGPGWHADERDCMARDLTAAVWREIDAARVVRRAEDIARQAVLA